MKKILLWISLLLILLLPFGAFGEAASQKVFDEAGVFSAQEKATLEEKIAEFEEKYGLEFAIVTTKTPHSGTAMQLADDLYDSGKYGVDPQKDGFLFLLDLSDSAYALSTCGRAVDYYTYQKASVFEEGIVSALRSAKRGDISFARACGTSVSLISELMDSYFHYDVFSGTIKMKGEKVITKTELMVTALIAVVTGLILSFATLSKYKLKGETYHYDVEKNARVTLTKKEDTFLRTLHTRTKIPKNNGSGHSGGGHSGGSRPANVHFSSGGVRHGGSSGHF